MKLDKESVRRLKKARHYLLFVIDDEGVGHFSQSSELLSKSDIDTLLYGLAHKSVYYWEIMRKKSESLENKAVS